jgi:hypothetical protein
MFPEHTPGAANAWSQPVWSDGGVCDAHLGLIEQVMAAAKPD